MFELLYMLREVTKSAQTEEVYVAINSLRDVIKDLLEEDNIVLYSSMTGLDEDLKALQKLSFITINNGKIVINKENFLNMTKFIEKQEELLKNDRYATAILEKLKQRARRIKLQS